MLSIFLLEVILYCILKLRAYFNRMCTCVMCFAPRLKEAYALKYVWRFYQH